MEKPLDIPSTPDGKDRVDYLLRQVEILSRDNDALVRENTKLADDVRELADDMRQAASSYEYKIKSLQAEHDRLIELIKHANARAFGAKSEKIHPYQISLFNDIEAAATLSVAEPVLEDVLAPKRKKKRLVDWSRYETEIVDHKLPAQDLTCTECGGTIADMGYDITRTIKLLPARLVVEEHHVHKYVCASCSKNNAIDGVSPVRIIQAAAPVKPIPKSAASPSLLAYILKQKYELS
ncbi:IS66 family transposase zinc-finger binding domain-containing protein, partial [Citrobacter sp.]|uniref:IS66 family transposase zinc-finger binding domain-containing protein n=1 Tax=Citrobacter sp. TaxID=1896336 RepID=UPI002FCA746D